MSVVVPFAEFGVDDLSLYREYLELNRELTGAGFKDGRVFVVTCRSCTAREGGGFAAGRGDSVVGGKFNVGAGGATGGFGGQKRFAYSRVAARAVVPRGAGSSWSAGVRSGSWRGSFPNKAALDIGGNANVDGAGPRGVLGSSVGAGAGVESAHHVGSSGEAWGDRRVGGLSILRGEAPRVGVCEEATVGRAVGTGNLKPELAVDQDGDVVPSVPERGPNWLRNRESRERKKRQKWARKARSGVQSAGVGRSGTAGFEHGLPTDGTGSVGVTTVASDLARKDQEGFWNSCSEDVRQRLIDSKAEMHIAENLRRAKKAEEEVKYMESPGALLTRAMAMVGMAERCAKKKNDSKVAGWAETVATSYAESIAKSAPSSVPSYASVLSGTSASSVSVDGTKRKKPQAPARKLRTYEGDPQHPAKSYYERRIKYMNTPGGLDNILDELVENKALAELDRTWLINDCYEKKARLGSPSVLAVTVD